MHPAILLNKTDQSQLISNAFPSFSSNFLGACTVRGRAVKLGFNTACRAYSSRSTRPIDANTIMYWQTLYWQKHTEITLHIKPTWVMLHIKPTWVIHVIFHDFNFIILHSATKNVPKVFLMDSESFLITDCGSKN